MLSKVESDQRAPFLHAADCSVTFLKRKDSVSRSGKIVYVDLFEVIADGVVFEFQMMRMEYSRGPWVFGSFSRDRKPLWVFRDDVRKKQDGFKGAVYTYPYNGVTYALFTCADRLEYLVPFVQMLRNPQYDPDDAEDGDIYFAHYELMRDVANAFNQDNTKPHLWSTRLSLAEDVQEVLDENK